MENFFFVIVKSVIQLLGLLPISFRRGIAKFLTPVAALFLGRELRFARLQLENFLPGCSDTGSDILARETLQSVITTFFETLNLTPLLDEDKFVVDGFDSVEPVLSAQQGALVLTAHTGNWDLFGAWAVKRSIPIVAVGRVTRNAVLHRILEWMRARYGIITLWRGGATGSRACLDLIRSGKFVATLIDQDTRVRSSMAPFFGEAANTPSTLVELAHKENLPCFSAFLFRDGAGFAVYVRRLDDGRSDVQSILTKFNAHLEECIKKYPQQWVWFHKRWRTKTNGERMSSREYADWLTTRSKA